MQLHGWGRYPIVDAELQSPASAQALTSLLGAGSDQLIARGAGCSYGDSALGKHVISSRFLDNFYSLDEEQGLLHCGAGLTLEQLLAILIPKGLFLPVMPGTRHVSVGGAIAADIHGKNHHCDGCFGDHVESLTLALANGELIRCSAKQNAELFHATCGGMGLTGVIVDAQLRLEKVSSVFINNKTTPAKNLTHCIELLSEFDEQKYVVAWIDCLASGAETGRGIVHSGDHDESERLEVATRWGPSIPFSTPAFLLNATTMRLFNRTYHHINSQRAASTVVSYDKFFFPLDSIGNWNRLYGRKGFLQYQFLMPTDSAEAGIKAVLEKVSSAGKGSFLAVLKKFGAANKNLLSFPAPGLTLTLDFKREPALFPLLDELDAIVLAHDGKHYLAKDARLSETVFKAGYPNWAAFKKIKESVDPRQRFASLQSHRIGLTEGGIQS